MVPEIKKLYEMVYYAMYYCYSTYIQLKCLHKQSILCPYIVYMRSAATELLECNTMLSQDVQRYNAIFLFRISDTIVKCIPTTTVILIWCMVGISLFMIKKIYRQYLRFVGGMIVVGIHFLTHSWQAFGGGWRSAGGRLTFLSGAYL